jgi:hypothetical protein
MEPGTERERGRERDRVTEQKKYSDISSVLSLSPMTHEGGGGTFPFRTSLDDRVRSSERERERERERGREIKQTKTQTNKQESYP